MQSRLYKVSIIQYKNLVTPTALKANYQASNKDKNSSQYFMLKKLEFGIDKISKLKNIVIKKRLALSVLHLILIV